MFWGVEFWRILRNARLKLQHLLWFAGGWVIGWTPARALRIIYQAIHATFQWIKKISYFILRDTNSKRIKWLVCLKNTLDISIFKILILYISFLLTLRGMKRESPIGIIYPTQQKLLPFHFQMKNDRVPKYSHFSTYPNATSVFTTRFSDGFYHLSKSIYCNLFSLLCTFFTLFVLKAKFDANKIVDPFVLSLSENI